MTKTILLLYPNSFISVCSNKKIVEYNCTYNVLYYFHPKTKFSSIDIFHVYEYTYVDCVILHGSIYIRMQDNKN